MNHDTAIAILAAVAGVSFLLLIFCIIAIFKNMKDPKCQEKKPPPNG